VASGFTLFCGILLAQQSAPVETAEALSDEFSSTLSISGTVVSLNDARVAAQLSGSVTWVAAVGSRVAVGEAMATLDDADLQLSLRDNQAQIDSLQAQLDFQQSSTARLQRLAGQNNAAATQLDQAKSQLEMIQQGLNRARIAMKQTQRQIEKSKILAPFSGIVTERLIQLGEYVNPGDPVARLVDTDHREIQVRAPLSLARYIQPGSAVEISQVEGLSSSTIKAVIPVGDVRSRMFELRIHADNPAWVIGAAVQVALPNSVPRALVAIPRDALVLRGNQTFVYRIGKGDVAERVDVEVGIGLGGMVEVIGDVAEGDQLVTRGAERLQPGQSVTVLQSAG